MYNGYRVFPGGKVRPGGKADPSPTSSAEVKNRVELYLYSSYLPTYFCYTLVTLFYLFLKFLLLYKGVLISL